MSPPRIANFVVQHLDRSAAGLPPAYRERLKAARSIALEHRKVSAKARFAGLPGGFHLDFFAERAILHTAFALVFAVSLSFWHANRYVAQTADVDVAILVDELPIDALTDEGFDQWLRSSDEH